jgi:repressor of nif and glnA expression
VLPHLAHPARADAREDLTGNPGSDVKGIVTTCEPSLEVLHKAVAAGRNMIIQSGESELAHHFEAGILLEDAPDPFGVMTI